MTLPIHPSIGKSLVGPPIRAPRPALRAHEVQVFDADQWRRLAQQPNPMMAMVDRKPTIPYRPCSLPEQRPAKDALAMLAVSRDADEERPDEHSPGSRGHLLRRTVGCDFRTRARNPGRPTRAKDRRGEDRRVAWLSQGCSLCQPTVTVGGQTMRVLADSSIPPDRGYVIDGRAYLNPVIYSQLQERLNGTR